MYIKVLPNIILEGLWTKQKNMQGTQKRLVFFKKNKERFSSEHHEELYNVKLSLGAGELP